MSSDLDDLARMAAETLVSAMATDSWEVVKRRFAALVGHERRMEAARGEIAITTGPARDRVRLAQERSWGMRLRDALDDDPAVAPRLYALLADLNAVPAQAVRTSQRARADHRSQAVNIGGGISGNSGEVFVGVGKVDKRKTSLGLAPLMFVIGSAKKAAAAHPIVVTAVTAVALGTATVTGWQAHWPASVSSTEGRAVHSQQAGKVFGDSYSRWQVQTPDQASTLASAIFSDGLVLISAGSSSGERVTAYREATGKVVWSSNFPSTPVTSGNFLLAATYPTSLSAYRAKAAAISCPSAISRINPATGQTMWTTSVTNTRCDGLTASAAYVISGASVLSASDGASLQQLPVGAQGWAFGSDILVQDGSSFGLDTLRAGHLQPLWQRDIAEYLEVMPEPSQIVLADPRSSSASGTGPTRCELLNPGDGTIIKTITGINVMPAPNGVYSLSSAGKLFFYSASGTRTWQASSDFAGYYSGGILWNYRSPNGYSTGPVYAYAMDPDSFKALGRLVTTRAQVSVEGNNSYVVSDGKYAAIVAQPAIYIFDLHG